MVCFRLLIDNSFLDVTLRCITTTKCNPKTRQFVSCQRSIQNLVENEIKNFLKQTRTSFFLANRTLRLTSIHSPWSSGALEERTA